MDNSATLYQIRVRGRLDKKWANWLHGSVVHIEYGDANKNWTTITIYVIDQAALRGLINQLWDLNLTLISLNEQKTST